MKRILSALLVLTLFALILPTVLAETDSGTLFEDETLGMRFQMPEGISFSASDKTQLIILYPGEAAYPQMMIARYEWRDPATFFAQFDRLMEDWHGEEELTCGTPAVGVYGEKDAFVSDYAYRLISGAAVTETRVAYGWGGWTYLFTLKTLGEPDAEITATFENLVRDFEAIGAARAE